MSANAYNPTAWLPLHFFYSSGTIFFMCAEADRS